MKILTKALRSILEETIDHAITKKLRLRTETEDRLNSLQGQEQIATADLIVIFRNLLFITNLQDSVAADRYNLLRF